MNEACLNFLGEDLTSDGGQKFASEIMDFMRDLIAEIQQETGEIYNLEATPAVGTSYRLPYFTLTPTFSICASHGYLDGEQQTCPICNQQTEIYSRVVGYLRPVKQWNSGKQAEYADRKTFRMVS